MKSVEKRIKENMEAGPQRDGLLDLMKRFFDTDDYSERVKISAELFPFEKKFIPKYEGNCNVLIMSVGMRKEPVILSIISVAPERVFLLHTEGSRPTAEEVMNDPDIISMNVDFELVEIDEVDAANNYHVLKELQQKIEGDILVDPTGGRKIVGTVLGTFAFFYRIPMIYLRAVEQNGSPVPFTGFVYNIENPYTYYGDIELSLLEKEFENYAFDAALDVCEKLIHTVKDKDLYFDLETGKELIELYRDWDAFLHSKHSTDPKKNSEEHDLAGRLSFILESKIERFQLGFVDRSVVKENIIFLEAVEQNWKPKMNICDKFRLVDLLLNADRRGEQGKYDDATARLYRCLEMCSTIKLEERGLKDVANPDYQAFSEMNGVSLDAITKSFGMNDGSLPEMLGLNQQMTLLGHVDDPIVAIYQGMRKGEDSLMNKRNRSVLAHGTNAVTNVDYEVFRNRTEKVIRMTIGNEEFDVLSGQAKFPVIRFRS